MITGLSGKILLVGDDRFLRKACEATLTQRGFAVVTAVDGVEGLQLARTTRPMVILLDLLMPKMPGLEVLRALKADPNTAATPVLILSNSWREEDKNVVIGLGAAGYYAKANLSLRELAQTVQRLVSCDAAV